MLKQCTLFLFFIFSMFVHTQSSLHNVEARKQDSIKSRNFIKQLGNGFFPTKYFNFDLRYLIKYNQYESIRTGIGGITNEAFSETFRVNGYSVYGFKDHRFKYSMGLGFRLAEKTNTWLNFAYTDDLQETGSTKFLTDKRFFQFFEPRLLNIDLFHKHITKAVSLQHQISPKILSETKFSISNVNPTYNYQYVFFNDVLREFNLSTLTLALQWSPFSDFEHQAGKLVETKEKYPKFTFQFTNSFKNVFKSNIHFSKLDFRTIHKIQHKNKALSQLILVSGITSENAPLTHLYHAYPNNINKETIMQRFSVAGLNSFETMFFNEFFSDKFTTIQFKHYLNPFHFSKRFKPQLVLVSRFAIGDITHPERHQNISFNALKKGYTESGFEINKLLFGFGLSFTYRYGAYHLPVLTDNFALKFTFNITL